MIESKYYQEFEPEMAALDKQSQENEKLYDEVHKAMEKCVERLDGKQMFGTTSPTKDIAQLGEVLNDIRSNQVQTIKEKANIKKTIFDLDIRKENSRAQSQDANTNQMLMRDILSKIQKEAPTLSKPTAAEMADNSGRDGLKNLDPRELGVNENDMKMISRFVQNKGKR